MSWAVGYHEGRWIGYGVPAICDHPGCGASIDRGMAYACADGIVSEYDGCGLFFCYDHGAGDLCERCDKNEPPFDPTPDTAEWLSHQLTDESWQQWRDENPELVSAQRATLAQKGAAA